MIYIVVLFEKEYKTLIMTCSTCQLNLEFAFDVFTVLLGTENLDPFPFSIQGYTITHHRIIHQGYSDSVDRQNAWTDTRNIAHKP
jgi:hypothetical protein